MPARGGRSKRQNMASESGTSTIGGDSEDLETPTSSARPRRSRAPKRYFDDDGYSPPPPTKRRPANRDTPSDAGDDYEEEEAELKMGNLKTKEAPKTATSTPATGARKPRGRPKKNPTPPRNRKSGGRQKQEEDVIYMDEDSEDDDDDDESDEDYGIDLNPLPHDLDDLDEDELGGSSGNLNDSSGGAVKTEDTVFCPWIDLDPATLPKLDLPETSLDIPIPRHSTMDAIEIYEILRSYHRTLRITPFTFEDFCAALISRNNSCIMAEIHMALLRVCLKSDDEEQTHYSVTETNNSINIMIHHLDTLTYAEILRQYIEAYPFADTTVREAINVENYPYVGYESKVVVLLFMSYRFLYSSEFKKVVMNLGKFQNDENCRVCGKSSGKVIGCTQCEAAFHVECSHLKPFPEVLVCNICKKNNNVRGVLPSDESVDREPLRSQPIGRDRYGRFYWFICRRIVVQSLDESEIHYYSTPPQLYQLLKRLDRDYYEKDLCEAIRLRIDEFLEQMTLTVEMTSERRENAIDSVMKKNCIGYEMAETEIPSVYLHKDSMKRMASILRDCSERVIKQEVKTEDVDDDSAPIAPTVVTFEEDSILPESMLGIFDGALVNTFWSGGASQEELISLFLDAYVQEENSESSTSSTTRFWRMGDEGNDQSFMAYYNYYSRNEMAESFLGRKKQADKKKYMASKFATIDPFEWVVAKDRQFYGNSVLHNKFVGWTLSKIARKIPADLMHRKWPEMAKGFDIEVSVADDFKKLSKCLLQLDAVTRKTIFMPQWWNGLGQTKLERITTEQRENFVKEQQRVKKMEADSLAKELDDSFVRVNYSKPKWPNTYLLRQKGETYRNAWKGGMGGWAWVARKYVEKWVPVPQIPQKGDKTKSVPNRKAAHLESLITRITRKRDTKSYTYTSSFPPPHHPPSSPPPLFITKCYSSSCRRIPNVPNPKCYITVVSIRSRILRSLIVTAGCQQVYMPGFSAGIKSNLLIWPYPAPRPTLDLCWKWQTLNSRSLHCVALQLKIMWSSIKWNEFDPEDSHPDRRVVIDTPTHDERRRIVRHKEMPPYGQYERYQLEIEIIPLYDEQEEEDESWLSRNRATDCSQRTSSNRKKRPQRAIDNRQATALRHEWVDGVTLKVFEIKDYWKNVRLEAEKIARRKLEMMKKAQKAKEERERQRLLAMQRKAISAATPLRAPPERVNVPYVSNQAYRRTTNFESSNGSGRYLEKYNHQSQLPPRTPHTYLSSSSNTPATPSTGYRIQPNPIRRSAVYGISSQQDFSPPTPTPPPNRQQQQYPYVNQSRAAAGSDYSIMSGTNGGAPPPYQQQQQRTVVMSSQQQQPRGTSQQNPPPISQQYQKNVPWSSTDPRNGTGVRFAPSSSGGQQQTRVVHVPYAQSVAEEAIGAPNGMDGQPPVMTRYETPLQSQQPIRQIYTQSGQQVRTLPSGTKGKVIYLQSRDGVTQKVIARPPDSSQQEYPPGTVLSTGPPRMVSVRAMNGGSQGQRQQSVVNYRRVPIEGGGYVVRKVVQHPQQPQQQRQMDYTNHQDPPHPSSAPSTSSTPHQPRFVLHHGPPSTSSSSRPAHSAGLPRGGLTMQMGKQHQAPPTSYDNGQDGYAPMEHQQ
ncbi:CRE-NURF-1 protein [Caenorhabditis remanei]|uniref:CRE-NURF-1 protein n=1 Tax=Caenorhabditis remanei TaxID=31234 RepID=E3MHN2_CAERE|nr:CRE-NURF-1 protein [Caenorhabditis remanei]